MTQHFMTITRFVTQAWDWMDEGAPNVDPAPDLFAQFRHADRDSDPDVSDIAIDADLNWVDNFNVVGAEH